MGNDCYPVSVEVMDFVIDESGVFVRFEFSRREEFLQLITVMCMMSDDAQKLIDWLNAIDGEAQRIFKSLHACSEATASGVQETEDPCTNS